MHSGSRVVSGTTLVVRRTSLGLPVKNGLTLLDNVGGQLVKRLFDTLAAGARIIAYAVQDQAPATVTNATLIYSSLTWDRVARLYS